MTYFIDFLLGPIVSGLVVVFAAWQAWGKPLREFQTGNWSRVVQVDGAFDPPNPTNVESRRAALDAMGEMDVDAEIVPCRECGKLTDSLAFCSSTCRRRSMRRSVSKMDKRIRDSE